MGEMQSSSSSSDEDLGSSQREQLQHVASAFWELLGRVQELQWRRMDLGEKDRGDDFEAFLARPGTGKMKHGGLGDSESLRPKRSTADFVYSIFSLQFRAVQLERMFQKYFGDHAEHRFKPAVILLAISATLLKIYTVAVTSSDRRTRTMEIIICCSMIPAAVVSVLLLKLETIRQEKELYISVVIALCIVVKHTLDVLTPTSGMVENSYIPLFVAAGARMRLMWVSLMLVFHLVAMLLRYLAFAQALGRSQTEPDSKSAWGRNGLLGEYFVWQFFISTMAWCYFYLLERFMRQRFARDEYFQISRRTAVDLLAGMFPEEVVSHVLGQIRNDRSQGGESVPGSVSLAGVCQDRGIVTVLFCDIMQFEQLVASVTPVQLVELLDRAFMAFDRICEEYTVTKIETVGKTYMAAGMPKDPSKVACPNERHAEDAMNTLHAAVQFLRTVAKSAMGIDTTSKISVRIGLNTGKVFSGVVGSQKPQFALFGDTVNTASRMQSTGEVNHVHISESTHQLVGMDPRFKWVPRTIQAKGKGEMKTFLLANEYRSNTLNQRRRSNNVLDNGPGAQGQESPKPGGAAASDPEARALAGQPEVTRVTSIQRASITPKSFGGPTSNSTPFFGPRFAVSESAKDVVAESELEGSEETPGGFLVSTGALWTWILCVCQQSVILEPRDWGLLWVSVSVFLAFYFVVTLFLILGPRASKNESFSLLVIIRIGYCAMVPVLSILFCRQRRRQRRLHEWAVVLVGMLTTVGFVGSVVSDQMGLLSDLPSQKDINFWTFYESFCFTTLLMHLLVLRSSRWLAIAFVAIHLTCLGFAANMPEYRLYPIGVGLVQLYALYSMKSLQLQSEEKLVQIKKEHEKVDQLLSSLLPKEVLNGMKSGHLNLAYSYVDMTLLFADIVGFTKYCASHSAEEAVKLVTRLFSDFDNASAKLGVYKVCTIGDAYVAVNEPKTVHQDKHTGCIQILRLAEAMLQIIVRVREQVGHDGLDMRIGLHHGGFVAGVIGTSILRYDIWGEDVLIGNSMESNGLPGNICVSEVVKEVLQAERPDHYSFEFRQEVELKNQRTMKSYLIQRVAIHASSMA